MSNYTASSLEEIAECFEVFADDQERFIPFQTTQRAKAECRTKAAVWRDAASILRQTTIVAPETQDAVS